MSEMKGGNKEEWPIQRQLHISIGTNNKYKTVSTYVKQTSPLAMSVEHTRFRRPPLSVLRRGRHHLMRQVGLRSRCAQCGLPRCSLLHLLPLRAPPECQVPALVIKVYRTGNIQVVNLIQRAQPMWHHRRVLLHRRPPNPKRTS